MKFIKKEKGITLIALIITIIVLLILAGISISAITGENGTLKRAGDASEKTKDAKEDEQVKLAVSDALSDGNGNLTTESVRGALGREFGADKVTDTTFTGEGPWTFKGERNTYTIESTGKISSKPPVKKDILTADNFTKSNYGDYITNYGIDIDGNGNSDKDDWRIFYIQDYKGEGVEGENLPSQGKRIFLIASDYVNANTPELIEAANNSQMKSGDDDRAEYVKYWKNDYPEFNYFYPEEGDDVSLFPKLFMFNKFSIHTGKNDFYPAMKCAASLLSTNNWKSFTKKGISDYAVGAPTLKMFQESWNSSHSGSEFIGLQIFNDGSYGISLGSGTPSFSGRVTLSRS